MRSHIQSLSWEQARPYVFRVNPSFAKIIDAISPSKQHKLYRVIYGYGDEILANGSLNLPCSNGNLLSLNNPKIKKSIERDLNYNLGANPVGLVLKNSIELFIKSKERIIPYCLMPTGKVFGLWRLLDSKVSHCPLYFLWGMTAGTRSLFMLPKISREVSHNRLKQQFQVNVSKPKCYKDHWVVFREIARRSSTPWTAEVLFFSKKWFSRLNDPIWMEFHRYLLMSAWESSGFWRNQFIWQAIFTLIQNRLDLKTSAYIADLVQHIFMVGVGALPGFAPAVDNIAGPIDEIQNAYLEHYLLENYIPTIMQPLTFSLYKNHQRPVYLSLQHPTAMELAPKNTTRHNALEEISRIHSIINDYFAVLAEDEFHVGETPLANLYRHVSFDCFHSDPKDLYNVGKSEAIFIEDKSFRTFSKKYRGNRIFSANSPFFNGCMRISRKC